ncbi:MAG: (2Fe-2S)-binding protein [Methylococcaceae bacterium]|nr:(2Fe-2S)-binding protein [Methylococcaceae bacterium]
MEKKQAAEQEKIICSCTGTTENKVKQLIVKGANDLDKIASATGASTGCGSCDILIIELLEKK